MNVRKKILVIRLGAIGDVVLSTIIASAIKISHPDYVVHYLTSSQIKPLIENHPHIDKIFEWDRAKRKSKKQFLDVSLAIMKEHYDIVYNLTYAIRNFLFAFMTFCPRIINRVNSNNSWVEDYFLTAKKGIKDIYQPDRLYNGVDNDSLNRVKSDLKGLPKPYIVLSPGGATNNNRQGRAWDIKNWKILSRLLLEQYGGTIFLSGSKSEQESHEYIKDGNDNIKVFSGIYNLKESNALYSMCHLMISGDTGPVHIASAHNIKTLSLLGSTSPDKIKPYGENGYYLASDFECKYCWQKKCKLLKEGEKYTPCMNAISTEMVMKKIKMDKLL